MTGPYRPTVALHTVSELVYTKSTNNLSDALICFYWKHLQANENLVDEWFILYNASPATNYIGYFEREDS